MAVCPHSGGGARRWHHGVRDDPDLAAAGLDTRVWTGHPPRPLSWRTRARSPRHRRRTQYGRGRGDHDAAHRRGRESVIFDAEVAAAFAEGSGAQMAPSASRRPWASGSAGRGPPRRDVRPRPVLGSRPRRTGKLLTWPGPETAADALRPVFDAIGRKTVWLVGRPGSIVKLVVNAYLSILIEGVAETMELADRLGISHQQLADVIEVSPLDAPGRRAAQQDRPRRLRPGVPAGMGARSVHLAISAAGGQPPPLLAALLASGTRPWPPATAARTSAPPASPCPPQTTPASNAAHAGRREEAADREERVGIGMQAGGSAAYSPRPASLSTRRRAELAAFSTESAG